MSKRAIILAGGKGVRLRPYTVVFPKPLMPIGDYPILEVVIRQLVSHGFDHVTLAVSHQAELIKAFFGNGSKWHVNIDYSLETKLLGTMGPLRLIPDLPEHFLVMNGDVLTNLNYSKFYSEHTKDDALFTVSSRQREEQIDYGVLETEDGKLCDFHEKPINRYEVSMGVYMVSRRVLAFLPKAAPYGFDNLMHDILAEEKTVNVIPFEGYWLDIGRPSDYMQAVEEFDKMKSQFIND